MTNPNAIEELVREVDRELTQPITYDAPVGLRDVLARLEQLLMGDASKEDEGRQSSSLVCAPSPTQPPAPQAEGVDVVDKLADVVALAVINDRVAHGITSGCIEIGEYRKQVQAALQPSQLPHIAKGEQVMRKSSEARRPCKGCNRDISHKHPNAKFHNSACKDRYWNEVNPRGYGLESDRGERFFYHAHLFSNEEHDCNKDL